MSKLSLTSLKSCDVILCTARKAGTSTAIRWATWSDFSHAILYLGSGVGAGSHGVIEAIAKGVAIKSLKQAFLDGESTYAVVYRNSRGFANKETIIKHAEELNKKGLDYNYTGLVRDRYKKTSNSKLYCSELVCQAYEAAGIELVSGGPGQSTPKKLATSPLLKVVGELDLEFVKGKSR